jgi:hypothetical protein
MGNTLYNAEQVAQTATVLASEDGFLSALVNRNFENDLLGGGGKGRSVNIRRPAALVARERGIDETEAAIVLDTVAESVVSITLGSHLYSAVPLSEGDLSLDLENFARQILAPQVDAVVEGAEEAVAAHLRGIALDESIAWNGSDPVKTFTAIRAKMRAAGVPATGLNVVVGTNVYAALLDAQAITDASESGSTAALREGQVGRLRGFTVVESTRVDDDEIVAFHRDAITLAVRAPRMPEGATFGQSISDRNFSLRYLRDYDATHMVDRSIVSTFAGVADVPLYKIVRNNETKQATIQEVAATFRMSIG